MLRQFSWPIGNRPLCSAFLCCESPLFLPISSPSSFRTFTVAEGSKIYHFEELWATLSPCNNNFSTIRLATGSASKYLEALQSIHTLPGNTYGIYHLYLWYELAPFRSRMSTGIEVQGGARILGKFFEEVLWTLVRSMNLNFVSYLSIFAAFPLRECTYNCTLKSEFPLKNTYQSVQLLNLNLVHFVKHIYYK